MKKVTCAIMQTLYGSHRTLRQLSCHENCVWVGSLELPAHALTDKLSCVVV